MTAGFLGQNNPINDCCMGQNAASGGNPATPGEKWMYANFQYLKFFAGGAA
jgi:hypothetical protein